MTDLSAPKRKLDEEDQRILEQLKRKPLVPVGERAHGIHQQLRAPSLWTVPPHLAQKDPKKLDLLRQSHSIFVEGQEAPPPCRSFEEMKMPGVIIQALKDKHILKPTEIQMQAIPAILLGRDVIAIASTGSGKSLVFILPSIFKSQERQLQLELKDGEGPIVVILTPSRELATQTYDNTRYYCRALDRSLQSCLCIGGQPLRALYGTHIAVATPGRFSDLLNRQMGHLHQCEMVTLDEADRLIGDSSFEETIRNIIDFTSQARQTILFSATMALEIQEFARTALTDPLFIRIGTVGSVNLRIKQEVHYCRDEQKLVYLLDCLQKTPPPVLIFCVKGSTCDEILEYLLIKKVDVMGIHSGFEQAQRTEAFQQFQAGQVDVLVATDVASKGLDFPGIQHVINFDTPKSVEDYVHRIGRTGRRGLSGLATTFVGASTDKLFLLDLRAILIQSSSEVPSFLMSLPDDDLESVEPKEPCAYCGGMGHRLARCTKLLEYQRVKHQDGDSGLSDNRFGLDPQMTNDW